MHLVAARYLETGSSPPAHSRPRLIDRIPSQNLRQWRNLLEAGTAVKFRRTTHMIGWAAFTHRRAIGAEQAEVCPSDPKPRVGFELTHKRGEGLRREAQIAVQLGD